MFSHLCLFAFANRGRNSLASGLSVRLRNPQTNSYGNWDRVPAPVAVLQAFPCMSTKVRKSAWIPAAAQTVRAPVVSAPAIKAAEMSLSEEGTGVLCGLAIGCELCASAPSKPFFSPLPSCAIPTELSINC